MLEFGCVGPDCPSTTDGVPGDKVPGNEVPDASADSRNGKRECGSGHQIPPPLELEKQCPGCGEPSITGSAATVIRKGAGSVTG